MEPNESKLNEEIDKGIRQKGIWRKFLKMLRLARIPVWALVFYVVMNMVSIYIALLIPQIYGAFMGGDVSEESVISVMLSEIASGVVVSLIFVIRYYVNAKIDNSFRNAIWEKILSLPASYFDGQPGSTLISRITTDAESLRSFLIDVVISELLSIGTAVATIASMSTIRKELAIIMAVLIPLILAVSFLLGRIRMAVGNLVNQEMAELTGYLSSQLNSVGVIKAYNAEGYEEEKAQIVIDDYYKAAKIQKIVELVQALITTLIGFLPQISLILIGIRLLADRTLTVAGWVTFLSYATSLITFFTEKAGVWTNIKEVQGKLIRISDIMDQAGENRMTGSAEQIDAGDITYEKVAFAYGETKVFSDISFRIPQNALTLIVGPSGCGKSTSMKLLERIYPAAGGKICCGGQDIKECNLFTWRQKLAVVSQEAPMLSGSIRENLLYGTELPGSERKITDEMIFAAAEEIGCSRLLKEKGLDYEVGQFGEKLSGGQRQILSILRAKLQEKEIIILDEPTASLDLQATEEVLAVLKKISAEATVIVIAHDRQAIAFSDHIVVFEEDGTIHEGSSQELLADSSEETSEGGEKLPAGRNTKFSPFLAKMNSQEGGEDGEEE